MQRKSWLGYSVMSAQLLLEIGGLDGVEKELGKLWNVVICADARSWVFGEYVEGGMEEEKRQEVLE